MAVTHSFDRYEIKYLLTEKQKSALIDILGDRLCRDRYADYTICNLYLDTDDFYFIERSLEHPVYKEKLRVRSYGNIDKNGKVFFEIKKKFRKVVYKRRIVIPYHEAVEYMQHGTKPSSLSGYSDYQIFNEIDYLMKKHLPQPKLYLAYDREAYFIRDNPEMRVTFDRNIRGRWTDLTLSSDSNTHLLDTGVDGYSVMEIKIMGAMPKEYADILCGMGIYPASFSKYGQIYLSSLQNKTSKEALHE